MKGRVGRLITLCLLVILLGLLPSTVGCQRAKPARTVVPLAVNPRIETPVIARVAAADAGYPAPTAPATVVSQAAYPSPEAAETSAPTPTEVTPEPTAPPTAPPTATPTSVPTVAPTAPPTPETPPSSPDEVPPTPLPEIAYRMQPGDSVGSIAVLFNSTTAAILARNGLSDATVIRVGQTLIIPATHTEALPTGSMIQHRVQAGETWERIAGYYRTTVEALHGLNPDLATADALDAGTVLTVIAGAESAPRRHVVRVGESLSTIAESYGITTQALARANGLTDPSRIRVGQTLIIP
jgi:LysM repeat protein